MTHEAFQFLVVKKKGLSGRWNYCIIAIQFLLKVHGGELE